MCPRILLVDDDIVLLDLYRDLLQDTEYALLTQALPALQMAELDHLQPDLILLDWRCGHEAQGCQVLKWMLGYPPRPGLPVVVCCPATPTVQAVEGMLRSQGVVVVYKPFDRDELLSAIMLALQPVAELQARTMGGHPST